MTLDLFITHWNEPWKIGKKGFQMLALQRLVDWDQIRITLVHDGSEKFPDEYFEDIPCGVRQVAIPHGGIAAARNWCIDNSDATWIKWNDFDDMFANVYALNEIISVLDTEKYDLLWFDLLWQDREKLYLRTNRNPVFVHDKVFRRTFLTDNQIRFNESLTWCEDSAFMAVVEMEINHERIGKIRGISPIYLYNVRDGSLCNRPEIKFQNLQSFFDRHCYVADEFNKRGKIQEYRMMVVRAMADSYYTLKLAPGIQDSKTAFEQRVWNYYDRHRNEFRTCGPENFDFVLAAVNRERFDGGEITKKAFLEWIGRHERGE